MKKPEDPGSGVAKGSQQPAAASALTLGPSDFCSVGGIVQKHCDYLPFEVIGINPRF